jgi:hypothetical protein
LNGKAAPSLKGPFLFLSFEHGVTLERRPLLVDRLEARNHSVLPRRSTR